jgi:succinoglycan biosynthesis transport protein ExoP
MKQMTDQLEQTPSISVRGWWLRVCDRRLLLMFATFSGWLLLTAVGWLLPGKYRSETVILIEQQRVPEHYVEPNVALDLQQRLQSMSEQILSRTRLLGIIEKFHLYGERQADSDNLLAQMRKDIMVELIRGERADQISAFKVSYSANSSVVAQQVTAELTSLFIEENLRNREQLAEDTTTFLESELVDARRNLDQQEARLREFKNRYMGQLPEQTTSNLQILSGLQGRLQATTDALNQAQQQRLYLQSLLTQYRALAPRKPTSGAQDSSLSVYSLDEKLTTLRAQLADLKAKYTSRHPDIVRLNEEIAATEKLRSQAEEEAKKTKSSEVGSEANNADLGGDAQTTPAIAQVQSQLKANEFDMTNRKAEIQKLESDIDSYQQRLNLAPAREQELAAITRDHEQSRLNYESLLAKRNQSNMATNLEKRQQGEQFRMIDPPSLPQRPYFPNRLYFSVGGLAFGVAVGLALVVLLELLSPRLYTEEEIDAVLDGGAAVTTVPPFPTAAESRKQMLEHALELATATTMFIVIPVVTFLLHRKG